MAGKPKEEARVDIHGGDVQAYIHRRSDGKQGVWHFRANFPSGRVRQSTGTSDTAKAMQIAKELLVAAKERERAGKTAKPTSFESVAAAFMAAEIGEPDTWAKLPPAERKKRYDARKRTVEYLVPYFVSKIGRAGIDTITDAHIRGYRPWREMKRRELVEALQADYERRKAAAGERWDSSPRIQKLHPDRDSYLPKKRLGNIRDNLSPATINHDTAILNAIFKFAAAKDLVKTLPAVPYTKVKEHTPRTGFTDPEFALIRKTAASRFHAAKRAAKDAYAHRHGGYGRLFPKVFVGIARNKLPEESWTADVTAWGRFVLMHVIDLLEGTGMRPSTLAEIQRWHVSIHGSAPPPPPTENDGLEWLDPEPPSPTAEAAVKKDDAPPRYILVGKSRKGSTKDRPVEKEWQIVPDRTAAAALDALLGHLNPAATTPLVTVTPHALNHGFKKILRQCGLDQAPDGTAHSLYDLRHRYITRKILAGIPLTMIARNTMTSPAMIERHYNHLRTGMAYEQIAEL